jgi:hypothetical protein
MFLYCKTKPGLDGQSVSSALNLEKLGYFDASVGTTCEYAGIMASDFCYPNVLLEFVINEGVCDDLDQHQPYGPPLSPLSSLTTTPQISRSPSPNPLSSVPSSTDGPNSLPTFGQVAISKTQERRNYRNKMKSKKNKKKKAEMKQQPETPWLKAPPSSAFAKHVAGVPQVGANVNFADDSRPASTGYIGMREGQLYDSEGYWFHDLVGPGPGRLGFQLIDWDGV